MIYAGIISCVTMLQQCWEQLYKLLQGWCNFLLDIQNWFQGRTRLDAVLYWGSSTAVKENFDSKFPTWKTHQRYKWLICRTENQQPPISLSFNGCFITIWNIGLPVQLCSNHIYNLVKAIPIYWVLSRGKNTF